MPGNSFGQAFRITTAGESHGPGYVVIIDGVPPGIPLSVEDLAVDLRRRRPGQSRIVSQRDEPDEAEIFSGVFECVVYFSYFYSFFCFFNFLCDLKNYFKG